MFKEKERGLGAMIHPQYKELEIIPEHKFNCWFPRIYGREGTGMSTTIRYFKRHVLRGVEIYVCV